MGGPTKGLGKLVHPNCSHAPDAKAFLISHQCFQDRVRTERGSQMANQFPSDRLTPLAKSKSLTQCTALELARHEYHPIGGFSKLNNNSNNLFKTMAPNSWLASGGLKTEYQSSAGKTMLQMFGAPPQAVVQESALDKFMSKGDAAQGDSAMREAGAKRARADQLQNIQQHGEGTILGLQQGRDHPANPAEAYVFGDGGRGSSAPQSGGQKRERRVISTGCSRRSDESLGSVSIRSTYSSPASELRAIHELGDRAREMVGKNAKAMQAEGMRQHGQSTLVGLKQGLIASGNDVEEQLLGGRRRGTGEQAELDRRNKWRSGGGESGAASRMSSAYSTR